MGDAIGAQFLLNGEKFHMQSILEAMLKTLTAGGNTNQTSENTRSGYWELMRARMVMLPQVEEEQEEDSVCGMF